MNKKQKEEHAKGLHHYRFHWHERLLGDPDAARFRPVISLAGHIMHRYHVEKGYAQFSIQSALKALPFSERALKRARKYLVEAGWIRRVPKPKTDKKRLSEWRANCYLLTGGPEDLVFEPDDGVVGDTDA